MEEIKVINTTPTTKSKVEEAKAKSKAEEADAKMKAEEAELKSKSDDWDLSKYDPDLVADAFVTAWQMGYRDIPRRRIISGATDSLTGKVMDPIVCDPSPEYMTFIKDYIRTHSDPIETRLEKLREEKGRLEREKEEIIKSKLEEIRKIDTEIEKIGQKRKRKEDSDDAAEPDSERPAKKAPPNI
jgi:hypothetical protein